MTPNEARARLASAIRADGAASSDFDLNPQFRPPKMTLRPAAVLVAVDLTGPAPRVLLTKRASSLKHHPGQIAFPGGKFDQADGGSAEAAALREAQEEVGLPPDAVRVLGPLPAHETVTGFSVTPVLATVEAAFEPVPEPGEVDEVFTVPLSHVLNPANYGTEYRIWRGQRRGYFVVPWGPYYIWGATARILRALADRATP